MIKLTEQEMIILLKDQWKADAAEMLNEIIIHARGLNFQAGERHTLATKHGTEYLYGLLERKIISNDLYQDLKRVAEDLTIEYEIKI